MRIALGGDSSGADLELTWAANAKRRPAAEELAITTLNNQGAASSWWNNLIAVKQAVKPTVSGDGRTYVYDLGKDTCGIVVSVVGDKIAIGLRRAHGAGADGRHLEEDGRRDRVGLRPGHRQEGLQRADRNLRRRL